MLKTTLSIVCILLVSATFMYLQKNILAQTPEEKESAGREFPADYFFLQRAFPYETVPSDAYYDAVKWANSQAQRRSGPTWTLAGPLNAGGRVTDVAMHASDQQTIYVATATGGVWKSTDTGQNWFPISDALPSLSIGDIAIDPSDKNVIYCGTGEPNAGGGSVTYDGRGLFKSTDGGQNWSPAGLENCGSIGRIEIDPQHPNRVFVAAQGNLFGNNSDRGVYRSTDGGLSWEQKLFVSDSTGAIDLVINPKNPDTVYAAMWQRVRRPNLRRYGGPECGIYRSTDGGDNWTKLGGGLPSTGIGRIGLAVSATDPNILYATIATENGGFSGVYKSINNGDSWTAVSSTANPNYSNFGWWFCQIRVSPFNPNVVYNLGVDWLRSTNGGSSWGGVSNYLHADYHAFFIHPANSSLMLVGNDGGLYISTDGGNLWTHRPFPVTQFYTSEIDFQNPERLYGGAQDNGTWRTVTGALDDWESIWYGDGFVTLVNPVTGDYYAEYQYGNFTGSNGAAPPSFNRSNWNTPYVMDPSDPSIMYFGANQLFKSADGGLSWEAASDDLSNGPAGMGGVVYGTITSIAVSPLNGNIIYAGTDDGNLWVTENGGQGWTKISGALPKRWVTRVVADLNDESTAYVCLSGFRHFENISHIYKTSDKGGHWTSMSGNLPDVPVNDLIQDPLDPQTFYIGTDAGVFSTGDGGAHWEVFGSGLPNAPVLDLTFHAPTRALVAATYGRAMFRTEAPAPTAVAEIEKTSPLKITPNPARDHVNLSIDYTGNKAPVAHVYDAGGRLTANIAFERNAATVRTEGWKAGVYFIQVSVSGRIYTQKLVKL